MLAFMIDQTWFKILIQIIGIAAFLITALSFQIKTLKKMMVAQCVSSVLWIINFYFLGSYAGALMNFICLLRCIVYAFINNKTAKWVLTGLLCAAFAAVGVITVVLPFFGELWFIALLTASASIAGNIFICLNNDKIYRYVQLFYISPCWLFNNIWYLSIGGILCESFDIISVIISLIRFHRKKKEPIYQ